MKITTKRILRVKKWSRAGVSHAIGKKREGLDIIPENKRKKEKGILSIERIIKYSIVSLSLLLKLFYSLAFVHKDSHYPEKYYRIDSISTIAR